MGRATAVDKYAGSALDSTCRLLDSDQVRGTVCSLHAGTSNAIFCCEHSRPVMHRAHCLNSMQTSAQLPCDVTCRQCTSGPASCRMCNRSRQRCLKFKLNVHSGAVELPLACRIATPWQEQRRGRWRSAPCTQLTPSRPDCKCAAPTGTRASHNPISQI